MGRNMEARRMPFEQVWAFIIKDAELTLINGNAVTRGAVLMNNHAILKGAVPVRVTQ